jgi:hypothetical protein
MDTAHHIDQNLEYPTYPIGRSDFINTIKTESSIYELFKGFSTLNVEP